MKVHIFDMDGLLINSEPFWRSAEISVFTKYGINFTEEMCLKTVGMRIDEVVRFWQTDYPFLTEVAQIADEIQNEVIRLVKLDGAPLPGVIDTLNELKDKKRICALASSSNLKVIIAVLERLHIADYFTVIHSAEFEKQGKPHPDVFLTTASKLSAHPSECIVYEDSQNGMLAGLAANMKVVLIPEHPTNSQEWFSQATLQLNSMSEFDLLLIEEG